VSFGPPLDNYEISALILQANADIINAKRERKAAYTEKERRALVIGQAIGN
jgi:hypothetical protein